MPCCSPWPPKWSQIGGRIYPMAKNAKTLILDTPHMVWQGPGAQIWTNFVYFFNTCSWVSSENPPGQLFRRFGVHLGAQTWPQIDLKSSPALDMIAMWPQKGPVGIHRSLQDPKMVPKACHKKQNGFQNGIKKMTQGNPLCYFVEGVGGMSEATK